MFFNFQDHSNCFNMNNIELCSQQSNVLSLFKNEEIFNEKIFKDFKDAEGGFLIYMKPACPYCIKAIGIMDQNSLKSIRIDVNQEVDKFDFLKITLNARTVPQIFDVRDLKNVKHVGGCDDFLRYKLN
jgi:glutaredoxin